MFCPIDFKKAYDSVSHDIIYGFLSLMHIPPDMSPMILSPAVNRWGPPRRQGLCSQPAHLWTISYFAPPPPL